MSIEAEYNVSIAGYTIVSHLGGGGFGTVFLASSDTSRQLVAIKVLHQLGYDPEKRFDREIRILQERSNQNCVEIFDFGVTNSGLKYYAMEYCPLGNIRKLLGYVNPRFTYRLLIDICYALGTFHSREGFHRDLKPDNILLWESQDRLMFKLGDFGLAQDNNTSSIFTNNAAGTLGYIAPEIIAGEGFTPASDIYSLGVTVREAITGNLKDRIPSMGELGFLQVLTKMMTHRSPTQRPTYEKIHSMAQREEIRLIKSKTKTVTA